MADAGVAFDDVRLEDIEFLKPVLPFGQVPLYEEGDFKLVQSAAISRYLARMTGLYGSCPQTDGEIDMVVDGVTDIRAKVYALESVAADKKVPCSAAIGTRESSEAII